MQRKENLCILCFKIYQDVNIGITCYSISIKLHHSFSDFPIYSRLEAYRNDNKRVKTGNNNENKNVAGVKSHHRSKLLINFFPMSNITLCNWNKNSKS